MKIVLTGVFILLFTLVVGFPYKYEKESFIIIDPGPDKNIKISIDPEIKNTFLGIPVLQSSPYSVSIYCFEKLCMHTISKINIQIDDTKIEFSEISIVTTNGGVTMIYPAVTFSYLFKHDQDFLVDAQIGKDNEHLESVSWNVRFQKTAGFSFIPLWVYFTH